MQQIDDEQSRYVPDPEMTPFVIAYDNYSHYKKVMVMLDNDANELYLKRTDSFYFVSNLMIFTKVIGLTTIDDVMLRLKNIKWYFDGNLMFDVDGKYLMTIIKNDKETHDIVIESFKSGYLVIPIQKLVFMHSPIYLRSNEKLMRIIYDSNDVYEGCCEGFASTDLMQRSHIQCHKHILINQYAIFETNNLKNFKLKHRANDVSDEQIKVTDIIISPKVDKNYNMYVDDIKLLKGNHPLMQVEEYMKCDNDKYYFHSGVPEMNNSHEMRAGTLLEKYIDINVEPICPNANIIIKYKTVFQYCGGFQYKFEENIHDVVEFHKERNAIKDNIVNMIIGQYCDMSPISLIDENIMRMILVNALEESKTD